MGFGKILGLAALGVGAIAAAPFTGGGSILGAASIGASLAGAGTIAAAAGAGVAGAAAGVALSRKEEEENAAKDKKIAAKDEKIAELNKKAEKFEEAFKQAIEQFKGDKEYFNYIIASTAMGMSIANADGEIAEEELVEINEFIGGMASSNYPEHVKQAIIKLRDNPPSFNQAMKYLEKVEKSNIESIRDLIEIVIEADGKIAEAEKDFLNDFDVHIQTIEYKPELNDTENTFILEVKERIVA